MTRKEAKGTKRISRLSRSFASFVVRLSRSFASFAVQTDAPEYELYGLGEEAVAVVEGRLDHE
ncbi:MAG: hypothetical protein DRI79_14360 [Chloroflexi bacterium]|nr:MAG: hypothetical protein DRI79_14360 [Chloroflexota bacterium]